MTIVPVHTNLYFQVCKSSADVSDLPKGRCSQLGPILIYVITIFYYAWYLLYYAGYAVYYA